MRQWVWGMMAAVALALAVAPASAAADPEQFAFEESAVETGRIGTSDAGGHPTVFSRFRFKTDGLGRPHGTPQRVAVDMPYGLVGDPSVIPHCPMADFRAQRCPPQSQVGVANPQPYPLPAPLQDRPIYLLEHDGGPGTALFGVDVIAGQVAFYRIYVRPDGGLRQMTDPLPQATPLVENKLTLWGVPADENRCNPNNDDYSPFAYGGCRASSAADWERKPFMTSPTDCTLVPSSLVRAWSYEGRYVETRRDQPHPPESCDKVPFSPSIAVTPTNGSSDGVTGLAVDLNVEQNEDPDGHGASHVRHVKMTLPEGVSINPGAAVGLETCADAAFGKGAEGAPTCPDAAQVGTVRITSPLLDHPLEGRVWMGAERPGERFRLFVHASGENAEVKLAGVLRPDARTGQITAAFDDNPPLPFSNLHLEFRGGERGVLAMPVDCGPKTASAVITPYKGGPDATPTAAMSVTDCPSPTPFGPQLGASVASTQAGAYTPLTMDFVKPDKHGTLEGLEVDLPPGLLAKVRGVPRCADADVARATCPAATQVGVASTSSGPGGAPLTLPGKVFFTGPYKGAPYGLAVAVPAKAGPYDLGMVVVRQALHIDPSDAHVRVVSDPLPTILEGVPLRLQRIRVTMDRPGFTLNPTSCAPLQFRGKVTAVGGALASPVAAFQATGCERLPLRPALKLALTGRKETTDGKHPGLTATMTQAEGESGLKNVAVKLPLSLALDPDNAQALCEYEAGLRVQCPESSIVGYAKAESPVLDGPLAGPVYFVKNVRTNAAGRQIRTLPTLLVTLRGEVALNLRASTSVVGNRLVSTFENIPDAPISTFQLRIDGGKNGILAAVSNICAKRQVADAAFLGQSGRQAAAKPTMALPCGMALGSRTWTSKAVTLKLTGMSAGRVVVSGRGVKRVTRKLSGSSPAATVRVPLTKAGRAALRRKRGALRLRVAFTPQGAKKASKPMTVTVKRAHRAKAKKKR